MQKITTIEIKDSKRVVVTSLKNMKLSVTYIKQGEAPETIMSVVIGKSMSNFPITRYEAEELHALLTNFLDSQKFPGQEG